VVYSWVDSFMIHRSDMEKLNDLLDDVEMGKLKVEAYYDKVFVESNTKWYGILSDGRIHARGYPRDVKEQIAASFSTTLDE